MLKALAICGLLSAAVFASLPWLNCIWNPVRGFPDPNLMGICTFGFPGLDRAPRPLGVPGLNGPYWGNLVLSLAYGAVALYAGIRKWP